MPTSNTQPFILNIWPDVVLMAASYTGLSLHVGHSIEIVLSTGKAFAIEFADGKRVENLHFCVIPQGCQHFIDSLGHRLLIVSVEPISLDAKTHYRCDTFIALQKAPNALKSLNEKITPSENRAIAQSLFNFAKQFYIQAMPIDPRIQKAIFSIRKFPQSQPELKEILNNTALSAAHLQRLFKQNTQLSIRQYSLWYRLRLSFESMVSGSSWQEAALAHGFTDYAHFCRKFKTMLGITPTQFFKTSQYLTTTSYGFYNND